MKIPSEALNAPGAGRTLSCIHEAALIEEGVWRAYYDSPDPKVFPVAQRRGNSVWITTDEEGNGRLLSLPELFKMCRCEPRN